MTAEEIKLISIYESRILALIDDHDMPRGDLQGLVQAIVLSIYRHGGF